MSNVPPNWDKGPWISNGPALRAGEIAPTRPESQGQSKRADALEQDAIRRGIKWEGRTGGTWTIVGCQGPMYCRTIGQVKELLDSGEHDTFSPDFGDPTIHAEDARLLPPRTPDDDEDEDHSDWEPDPDLSPDPDRIDDTVYFTQLEKSNDFYLAKVGDYVLIDARTENEIRGEVTEVRGDLVTVVASRVLLRGQPRPDFCGFIFFPFQNGTERPWGHTNCLEKA